MTGFGKLSKTHCEAMREVRNNVSSLLQFTRASTHTHARTFACICKGNPWEAAKKTVIVGDGVVVGDKGSAEGRTRAGPSLDTLS